MLEEGRYPHHTERLTAHVLVDVHRLGRAVRRELRVGVGVERQGPERPGAPHNGTGALERGAVGATERQCAHALYHTKRCCLRIIVRRHRAPSTETGEDAASNAEWPVFHGRARPLCARKAFPAQSQQRGSNTVATRLGEMDVLEAGNE